MNNRSRKLNTNSGSAFLAELPNSRLLRSLIIFVTCLTLSSCGFHFRGTANYSLNTSQNLSVYIGFSSDDHLFERQLKNDLKLAKVTLVNDATQVNNHLIVVDSFIKKSSIGLDSVGRNNEFELSYVIDFVINNNVKQDMNDTSLLRTNLSRSEMSNPEKKTIIARRSLYIDRNDPIGKRTEEKELLESMRQEVSNKLVRQFISVTNYSLSSKELENKE